MIRYHFTPAIMASSNSLPMNAGEGVEKMELSYTVGGNVNWSTHYGKRYGVSSKNKTVI